MNSLTIIFILLNVVNVALMTVKSIVTIKGGCVSAAAANAVTYGIYTVVIIYTVCELPLWEKVVIVALANFFGVLVVKKIEKFLEKDKLWKIEATIQLKDFQKLLQNCQEENLNYTFYPVKNNEKKYYAFSFYCETQKDSSKLAKVLKNYDCKYFVSEHRGIIS